MAELLPAHEKVLRDHFRYLQENLSTIPKSIKPGNKWHDIARQNLITGFVEQTIQALERTQGGVVGFMDHHELKTGEELTNFIHKKFAEFEKE